MCKYCDGSNHFLLNDEFLVCEDILILAGESNIDMTGNQLLKFKECVDVSIDRGYLRMVGEDNSCIDHGERIKINFCPVCGEWLTNPEKD
jgi:hypothetical protein